MECKNCKKEFIPIHLRDQLCSDGCRREIARKRATSFYITNKERILSRQKNPEGRVKHSRNARRQRMRIKLKIANLLGGKCLNCGLVITEDNWVVFDFHDVSKDLKEKDPHFSRSSCFWKANLKNLQLFCANCHRLKHLVV